jgi:hypothetical protein
MSYVRPARKDEVVAWLLENGFAEENSGYGHVSADELAAALVEKWDLVGYFHTAT